MYNKVARLLILWAIMLSFFSLIIIACYEIRDITLAYLFASIAALVGLVLVIFAMIGYAQQEAIQGAKLSKLYSDFIASLRGTASGLWSPQTISTIKDFQNYFKRIYLQADEVPTWPQEEPQSTLKDAQKSALKQRTLGYKATEEDKP